MDLGLFWKFVGSLDGLDVGSGDWGRIVRKEEDVAEWKEEHDLGEEI